MPCMLGCWNGCVKRVDFHPVCIDNNISYDNKWIHDAVVKRENGSLCCALHSIYNVYFEKIGLKWAHNILQLIGSNTSCG